MVLKATVRCYKCIRTDNTSALDFRNKFLKIFRKTFLWILIKFSFSYLALPHWFSFFSDDMVTYVFCCSEDVIKSKILKCKKQKRMSTAGIRYSSSAKKKKKKAEQNLQESAIFVKLLAHTCNLRKIRTLLQMFCLWVLQSFSENVLIYSTSRLPLLKKLIE